MASETPCHALGGSEEPQAWDTVGTLKLVGVSREKLFSSQHPSGHQNFVAAMVACTIPHTQWQTEDSEVRVPRTPDCLAGAS